MNINSHYMVHRASVLLLVILSACSSQQPPGPSPDETKTTITTPSPSQPVKFDDRVFQDAVSAMQDNDLSTAQSLFNEFIRNNPNLSGAYVNLALIHFKQNKYQQSLELVNKAIQLNSAQAQAYQLRAQINILSGKINSAKEDYLKAIQLKPEYINAQYNLALLYDIYFQEINLAIKHYEIYQSLIDKPDDPNLEWINHLKGTLNNG